MRKYVTGLLVLLLNFIPFTAGAKPQQEASEPKPPMEKRTSRAPAQNRWLVMLYQDADDYQLEQDIYMDMNEAEMIGSGNGITIVTQFDRFDGSFDGDGDWNDTRRIKLEKDASITTLGSRGTSIGEANMSDGKTLTDFAVWAIETYPADKYVLILSDHGSGWPGGWSDPDPDEGDVLWMYEMEQALGDIIKKTGIPKFDVIGFDACLMGHLEVFSEIASHARYAVASQETEPGIGWAYSGFLKELKARPQMTGADLAVSIVNSYIKEDSSITSPELNEDYEGNNDEMIAWMSEDVTLSAIDLEKLKNVEQSLNYLTGILQEERQDRVAKARSYAQSYTNVFSDEYPSPYLDLVHFISLLKQETSSKKVINAADRVIRAVKDSVIAEKHGPLKPGSNGLSIYFPNSELYKQDWGGGDSYTYSVPVFASKSTWDDYLLFHYTGKKFPPPPEPGEAPEPVKTTAPVKTPAPEATEEPEEEWIVPGSGEITMAGITLDKSTISYEDSVTLTTTITGSNIAYIYLFVGYYDKESDSILIADKDFVEADGTRELDGIYYPDWPDMEEFELEFEWEPILFSLADDTEDVFCLLEPVNYGKTADDAIYYVDGNYTTADRKDTRYAQIYFDGQGKIMSVYGFSGQNNSAPHEIRPREGDMFTIMETWYGPDDAGNYEWLQEPGGTVTFGKSGVEWYDFEAYSGEYIIGFIVEDFDGNIVEQYANLVVTEPDAE